MRLISYARTSGLKDAEESLDAQGERNAACAVRLGYVVVGFERDEHVRGGLPVAQRPGLLATIMAIEDGRADGFIVHRLDRLARELHIQEAALAQAWAVGEHVTILEASGREVLRDDPDDPHRTFLRQVLGAAAQLERGLIVARLQGGRRRKASRGGSWRHHIKVSRCAARSSIPPEFQYADYGFRVAGEFSCLGG